MRECPDKGLCILRALLPRRRCKLFQSLLDVTAAEDVAPAVTASLTLQSPHVVVSAIPPHELLQYPLRDSRTSKDQLVAETRSRTLLLLAYEADV